jgi:hypothetical protein
MSLKDMAAPIFNLTATEEAKDGWKKPNAH